MGETHLETDVIVIGCGAAGMSAALTAKSLGLDVIILERSELVAGSTAFAGGGIWVPANHFMREEGDHDSPEIALAYLEEIVGDEGPATSTARKRAYVENVNTAIEFLERLGVRFRRTPRYPDYHPDRPGASIAGRGIESALFDMNKLGEWSKRFPPRMFPRSMPMGTLDVANLMLTGRTLAGLATFFRIGAHFLWSRATGHKLAGGGSALAGQMLYQVLQQGIPVFPQTRATALLTHNGRVSGVAVTYDEGRTETFHARCGVFLGAGGFARNAEMRKKYQPSPVTGAWTSASKSDLGDGIRLGMDLGAAVALMDDAWWGPASVMPNGVAFFHTAERAKPGSLMVDASARRFFNESMSYVDAVHIILERNDPPGQTIPSWLIFDHTYRKRYPFGTLLPGRTPKELIEQNYFRRADTIAGLAKMCGLDPDTLAATIARFNTLAIKGKDDDFGRGDNVYDTYFGDPRIKPNPCLGPVRDPPFYAVALYPGDLGTKGGLVTDEHARVLRDDGSAIEGLYASGNTSASVMGRHYPGPGVTLGPAITFAHLAMKHLARQRIADSTTAPPRVPAEPVIDR